MWHVGPPHRCDVVLRPRGRAAGGPHKAQEAHRARTHGRKPRVSTRVHVGDRVGCHVAGEVGIWRAHYFLTPLCPTRFLPFAGNVDARRALDSVRMAEITWTRVHTILITTRALKWGLSEVDQCLTWRHVDAQGEPDLHRTNDD